MHIGPPTRKMDENVFASVRVAVLSAQGSRKTELPKYTTLPQRPQSKCNFSSKVGIVLLFAAVHRSQDADCTRRGWKHIDSNNQRRIISYHLGLQQGDAAVDASAGIRPMHRVDSEQNYREGYSFIGNGHNTFLLTKLAEQRDCKIVTREIAEQTAVIHLESLVLALSTYYLPDLQHYRRLQYLYRRDRHLATVNTLPSQSCFPFH